MGDGVPGRGRCRSLCRLFPGFTTAIGKGEVGVDIDVIPLTRRAWGERSGDWSG